MAAKGFDYDRGVLVKKHPSGILVGTYFDAPGRFYLAQGNEAPEKFASEAGFDVVRARNERIRKERLTEFEAMLERELELAGASGGDVVLAELGGYKVLGLQSGLAKVVDGNGKSMTKTPLPEELAIELLTKLTGQEGEDNGGTAA